MSNTEEKAWAQSFQTGPRLSPQEAHRSAVLRQRLTGLRYLSSEYLLRRATHSGTKSERVAWESVWALLVFVEHQRRFPRQGELYPYLQAVLDESKLLEDLDLPEIDISPISGQPQDAQKDVLESLVVERIELLARCKLLDDRLEKSLRIHQASLEDDSLVVSKKAKLALRTFVQGAEALRTGNPV